MVDKGAIELSPLSQEELDRIIKSHRMYSEGSVGGARAVLTDRDLSNLDFHSADMNGADFSRSKFKHSNMSAADFTNAIFSGCDLRSANLQHAKLARADFRGAKVC